MSALKQSFVVMLKSNASWAKQLEKALGGKTYLPEQQVAQLAEAVVEVYDCYVGTGSDGGFRFYKTEEAVSSNRHDGAQRAWQRHVAKYHKVKRSNRGGNTASGKAQEDVVEKALELVESMTKAQQEKFFKRVSRK